MLGKVFLKDSKIQKATLNTTRTRQNTKKAPTSTSIVLFGQAYSREQISFYEQFRSEHIKGEGG